MLNHSKESYQIHRSGMYILVTMLCVALFIALPGCSSSGSGGNNDDGSSTDNTQAPGGNTGGDNSSGDTGGGTGGDTGGGTGGDTGSGTGGDTGSGTGGDTGGGTGGDTGGGSDGGTTDPIYGVFTSLYIANNVDLTINSCSTSPAISGSRGFLEAAFRLVNQTGNAVNAAITLTPNANLSSLVDQVFMTISGNFISQGVFEGTLSATYSLNGDIVAQSSGTVIINQIGTSITVEFVPVANSLDCSLVGGPFLMSEEVDPTDPGGGGTGGGDTGGGTGGDTGGGTGGDTSGGGGTGTDGTIIESVGQFGLLTFSSQDFPDENASIEMIKVVYTTITGFESFAFLNTVDQATVNIYFGDDPASTAITNRTTYSSPGGRSFDCFCFPAVDLVNSEVSFNNIQLTTRNGETITISGVVAIPNLNQ